MKRYVDVDELKENICKRVNNPVIRGWLNGLINDTSAADVVEVTHGRWITDDEGFVICSECREEHTWDEFRPPYCDMCGAKMDGERKDENA